MIGKRITGNYKLDAKNSAYLAHHTVDGLGKVANSGSTVSTTELVHLDLTVPWILAVLIRNLLNIAEGRCPPQSFTSEAADTHAYQLDELRPRWPSISPCPLVDTIMDPRTNWYNEAVDRLRDAQFPMLKDSIYLDHAGTTLPSKALLDEFAAELTSVLYGNPHSGSLPSQLSTDKVDDVRLRLLEFFNADPDDYDLVFVANATAGIKLVLDGLRNAPDGFNYVYHQACHTSLVGMREEAKHSLCVTDEQVERWIHGDMPIKDESSTTTLFSYTAQSHMNGRRYPTSWARDIKAAHPIYTLLDAASLGATSQLNMSDPNFLADFVVLSLYKIFGFPDLGILLVRKSAERVFDQRQYFGGGTVDMVVVGREQWHARKTSSLHERLEDGTLPFHNIIAAGIALKTHMSLFGSMDQVSRHMAYLTHLLYTGLEKLRHGNGHAVCTLYTPNPASESTGPVMAFNMKNSLCAWITLGEFEKLAIINKVHVRTGGLCSPGDIAATLDLQPWEMRKNFSAGFRCGLDNDVMNGKPVGVIRASLGAMSVKADVDGFLAFIREFFVEVNPPQLPEELPIPANLTGKPSLRVRAITVYPIKSCGGFTVPAGMDWPIRSEGLAWDREWCLLHKGSGQALSQKRYPRMVLLRPTLDFENGVLRIHSQGGLKSISIPLSADPSYLDISVRQTKSRVCGEEITAQMYKSEELNDFFSQALGVPCVLARFPPGGRGLGSRLNKAKMQKHQQADKAQRLLPGSFPDDVPSPPDSDSELTKAPAKILLSNESPILMIHSASLDALNEAIAQHGGPPATEAAFRANIILEGPRDTEGWDERPAYSEDTWRRLRIGTQSFSLLGACRRCQMVCVDQETGARKQEPLATLSKTRRFDGKIYFGAHMKHDEVDSSSQANQHPTIRVGEPVVVDG
ncbi:molybdenum cofactor sulfurase [Cordyceps militaris]|uniref:Molybdenum cofactor sulfurase n=1 Tax=Cordyceps militaris TaxID=73501 RepID=A0A2H4SH58_CORMI|nr:molybdenum cofactor sulfurase [Cordyceps militaris]